MKVSVEDRLEWLERSEQRRIDVHFLVFMIVSFSVLFFILGLVLGTKLPGLFN